LQLDLSELLTETLKAAQSADESPARSRDAIVALLRTYSSLNAIPIAEDIIRDVVVRPRLVRLIDRDNPGKPGSSGETSGPALTETAAREGRTHESLASAITLNGSQRRSLAFYDYEPVSDSRAETVSSLAKTYNNILAFVSEECGVLLDVGERSLAANQMQNGTIALKDERASSKPSNHTQSKQGYYILANVVWHEIATKLMNELGQVIFAAGRPSVFHEV
jgi:hypothetical protein